MARLGVSIYWQYGSSMLPMQRCRVTGGTTVVVRDSEEGGFSEMDITTADRPGLLTDIVKVLKDISVNVISAEVRQSMSFQCNVARKLWASCLYSYLCGP